MNREILNALIGLSPVVGLFLKVTLILGLGWALHFLLARANPRWRVLLWRAVAVGVLLVPLIASMMPAFELAMPQPAPKAEPPAPVVNDQIPAEPAVQPAIPAAAPGVAAPADAQPLDFVSDHPWLSVSVLYAIVCAAFALRLALSLRRVRRVLTGSAPTDPIILEKLHEIRSLLGVRRFVDLRASSALSSPFLYGLRRPVIILPERMTQGDYVKELPGIFVHELAHLQGRDLAWMNIIHFVSIALWFHPLAWRMRAAHAASCEAVCDAVAAEHVGSALNYSRTLARIALELVALPPAVGGIPMARMPEIRRRLELLKSKIRANRLALRWVVCAIIAGFVCVSMIARTRLVYAESDPVGPKTELIGTVAGPDNKPVANALVYIYEELMERYDPAKPLERGDKGKYVYTDAQGGFKIPALTTGYVFQVLVMADGYAPEFVDKAMPKSGAMHITLTAEPDQMKPGHTVFGKVVDQDGKPLPGVKVSDLRETLPNGRPKFYTSNRNVIFPIAITDRHGNFAIRSNEADVSMWLNFESPNMTKLAARDVKTSVDVQVFKMSPGATVTGKVIDDGKPVADVRIQLAGIYKPEQPDTWTGYGVSDKDGNFVFEHVAAGREYRLSSVISSPKMIADQTVNVAADAKRVDVGSVQTEAASNLFKLAGKVELSDGKPIPKGAEILVQRRMGEGVDAKLGADGRFEFKALPADTYSITPMSIPGYVLSKKNDHDAVGGFAPRSGAMDPVTKKIDRDTNVTVLLEPGEATPVYVVTSSDGTITAMASGNQPKPEQDLTGTVVSDKGEPVKGALVYVYLAGYKNPNFNEALEYPDIGKRERTDGQGRFTIRSLRPDQYYGVLAMADGYAPKYIYKVESLAVPLTFKLEPDAERTKPGHVVCGKVVGPDGKPLAGVVVETTAVEGKMAGGMFSVQAASGDLKVDPIAITDGRGEFRITSPDTNFKVNLRMRAPGLAALAAGKLSPGEDVRVFKIAQGATVVGRVLDHGKPVPDAVVDLNLLADSMPNDTMVLGSQAHVKTDSNGNFVFANAKSGLTYFISCRMISIKERGAVKGRSVRVERDGDRVDAGVLEIEPGFSLSGRVELSDGKPAPAGARVMIIRATSRDAQSREIAPDGRFEFKGLPPDVYEITPQLIKGYITSQTNVHDALPEPLWANPSGWGVPATKKVDRDVKGLRILVEPGEMNRNVVHSEGDPGPKIKPITFTASGQ